MKIAGKKGFYRILNPDRKMIKDGKEVIIKGTWRRVYGELAPDADEVYVPVVEEKDGLTMLRFKDLTLKVKDCAMVDLLGQKISFFRKDPDQDITKLEDPEQRLLPEKYVKHPRRIGLDINQVYIPIITTEWERVKLRFDRFMFEEELKGDK